MGEPTASPLTGKAVVVTGAADGIGRAVALAVANAGAHVVVNDVDSHGLASLARTLSQSGTHCCAVEGRVEDYARAKELIASCVEEYGRIDGLVNNAGAFEIGAPGEISEAMWRRLVDTNILGTAFCGTHAIEQMTKQGFGAIVNVTSGAHLGTPLLSAYGATKGAVASLTYGWAVDLAGTAVRVNALSPMAQTKMSDTVASYFASHRELRPWPPATVPPENNASVVVFLLSDASIGINGQVVRIDGDRLSLMSHPAILEPVLRSPVWNVETIVAAFDEALRHASVPVGLTTTEGRFEHYAPDYLPEKD